MTPTWTITVMMTALPATRHRQVQAVKAHRSEIDLRVQLLRVLWAAAVPVLPVRAARMLARLLRVPQKTIVACHAYFRVALKAIGCSLILKTHAARASHGQVVSRGQAVSRGLAVLRVRTINSEASEPSTRECIKLATILRHH
jgi:hypothetical protein